MPLDVPIPATVAARDLVTQSMIWPSDRESAIRIDSFVSALGSVVLSSLVAPLHLNAVYLPADRTGIMQAHRVVVSSLIANASSAGLGPVGPAQTMTGVLADFLTHLVNMNPVEDPSKCTLKDRAGDIEAILSGSVAMHRSPVVNYPQFTYRPEGWETDLTLANASSMVSDLAPLVLFLRHRVEPGNTLIVEEPESHLHPAKQVELTRQLVKLVHAGVRVVVTTHSEWLLEELANVVKRSLLPEDARERHANADASLRGDQVGVWLFEPTRRSGGSVVREARIDDSGLFPDGFDEVARALHNDWARMGNDIGSRS